MQRVCILVKEKKRFRVSGCQPSVTVISCLAGKAKQNFTATARIDMDTAQLIVSSSVSTRTSVEAQQSDQLLI